MVERVLGSQYEALPAAVRRFHRLAGHHVLSGEVTTDAPSTAGAWLLALCLGTPRRATQGPIRFVLETTASDERWTRHFPAQTMYSVLRDEDGRLHERLGAAALTFTLGVTPAGKLAMMLTELRFLGLPCPRWLLPQLVAEEGGEADRFHFEVRASVRLIGTVASYRGFLELPRADG